MRTRAFRQSFLMSYAIRIGERLAGAASPVTAAAGSATPKAGIPAAPPPPTRTPHTYANVCDSPVRVVSMHAPGGIEEFFTAQGAYFAQRQGPQDPEQMAAIWAGHPGRIAGPPIKVDTTPEPPG